MTARAVHRIVGLVMLLPFIGWAVTGAIFFLKPGYGAAYDLVAVKAYPIDAPLSVEANPEWLEVRYLKTILGHHLLVKTATGWQHLDPATRQPRPVPATDQLTALLNDALSANPQRYGHVATVEASAFTTDTGVRGTFNWNRLALTQRGADTDRIDRIYKIHYLQWTGIESVDRVLGAVGLACIVLLTALGLKLFLARRPSSREQRTRL